MREAQQTPSGTAGNRERRRENIFYAGGHYTRRRWFMKKRILVSGISAWLLALGLLFIGCGNPSNGDPGKVATPVASPAAGEVDSGTAITLTTTTAGAEIYYTTDGSAPSAGSTKYSAAAKPVITAAATIKAIALKDGMTDSDVLTAAYTVSSLGKAATPVASPAAGEVDSGTAITLTTTTTGADIYYTTDGSVPTAGSTKYSDTAKPVITATATIKAIALKDGMTGSDVLTAAYTVSGLSFTWTESTRKFDGSTTIQGVAYGGDKFVAFANRSLVYSSDGVDWTSSNNSSFAFSHDGVGGNSTIKDAAYGGGTFVAVGTIGKIAYSTDGADWTAVSDSKFGTTTIKGVAYGDGKFVAVGYSGKIAYSTDGETWTAVSDSTFDSSTIIEDVAYGGGKFVAAGWTRRMAYSTDGVVWKFGSCSVFGNTIRGVAYGGGKFVAVGDQGTIAYSNAQE
jgi:hypothetical protein